MGISVEDFFTLFIKELESNEDLRYYYKYLENESRFGYRKAYFCQRLEYVHNNVLKNDLRIWDCGCGFGTTAIFLSMNGIKVHGTTLEHYIDQIPKRLEFWKNYGDVSNFTYSYENIFDHSFDKESYDLIIIQDTLHHLEPLSEALNVLHEVLSKNGQLLIVEENGNNIIQNAKLFLQRGNKRIIEIYDEHLKKNILLGNENIRSLKRWSKEFSKQGFEIEKKSVQYIRYYLPFMFPNKNAKERIEKEQKIWKKNALLKEYFFFGINFMVNKRN